MSFLLIVQFVFFGASLTAFLERGRDADAVRQAVQIWLACIGLLLLVQLVGGFFSKIQEPVFWLIGWGHVRLTRDPQASLFVQRLGVSLTMGFIIVFWWRLHRGLARNARWAWFMVILIASFWAFGSISKILEGIWLGGRFQIGWALGVGTLHLLSAFAIGRAGISSPRRETDQGHVRELTSEF